MREQFQRLRWRNKPLMVVGDEVNTLAWGSNQIGRSMKSPTSM